MIMRPEEEANISQIERDKRIRENVKSGVKKGIGLAGGAALAGMGANILPFLNQYIPTDLAMKGISKVSPKIGEFLKRGQEMGLDIQEGLNFVKDKIGSEPAKENRNIIEQESPELHQFLEQEIKKGRKPIEAGALAQNNKKFKAIINKLTKNHKTPWSNILESVFGGEGVSKKQEALGKFKEHQKRESFLESELQRYQQHYGNQQQQQGGQGQAALMAILQKIQQSRGGQ